MDIRLDNARISFAQGLWNASAAVEGGTKKYNCDFIITPETRVVKKVIDTKGRVTWQPTTIGKVQGEVAMEAFKGDKKKAEAWFNDLDARQKSVRDGNKNKDKTGEVREGYAGCLYVHATSKTRMPVLRADRMPVVDEADSPIYSGCYVNARVSLYANLKTGQKGLFASLQGTQFFSDGDAFGGGRAASEDDFDNVAGGDAGDFDGDDDGDDGAEESPFA